MTRYIIRRLLWGVVLLVLVLALLFVIFRILPTADPAKLRAGRIQNPKIIAEIRHDLGLDKSLPAQFWIYIKGIFLHFNLGYSYYSNAPVKELIFNRLPATVSLVLGGAIIWLFAGLSVGIISARRAGSKLDRASMGTALVLVSAPEYWLGLLALFFFASDIGKIHIFPGAGSYVGLTAEPAKWFTSMIMPWLVVAAGTAAIYARLRRGSMACARRSTRS
jgi:peptide/nickel transport system permease protein